MRSSHVHRRLGTRVFWALILAITSCGVLVSAYRLDEPAWEVSHQGFNLSQEPAYARNYLRYGYTQSHLYAVTNNGRVDDDSFHYRTTHGSLSALLISLSYRIFGVHAWSARLVPLLTTVGICLLTALLAARLTRSRWAAVIALFACLFSPTLLFFGRLPVPHDIAVLFCVAAFYCYWRWFEDGGPRYLVGMLAFLAIGAFTDWIAYFVVPPLLLHRLLFRPKDRRWWIIPLLAAWPILLFGSFILWSAWVTDGESLRSLWSSFQQRTGYETDVAESFGFVELWWTFLKGTGFWITWPFAVMTLAWLCQVVARAYRRDVSPQQGLILGFFLMAICHNLMLSNRVMVHDVIMFFHWVPGTAVAVGALGAWTIGQSRKTPSRVGTLLLCGMLGCSLLLSVDSLYKLHSRPPAYLSAVDLGWSLREWVSEDEAVGDASGLEVSLAGARVLATADRASTPVTTLAECQELVAKNRVRVVVVSAQTPWELREWLCRNFPRIPVGEYSVFDVRGDGSDVLVERPGPEPETSIRFGSIEYLGHELPDEVVRKDRGLGMLDRYLCQHADLLPEHRTELKLVSYWRKIGEDNNDYTLATVLQTEDGHSMVPSSDSVTHLFPTSAWPVGQLIREERSFRLGENYPSSLSLMLIAVLDGDRHIEAAESRTMPSPWVSVGSVNISEPRPVD